MENILWQTLLGGKPKGRNIEQHDITFVVGPRIDDCVPALKEFWPIPGVHVDSYMPIRTVGSYRVHVVGLDEVVPGAIPNLKLFFLNLGGYLPNDPEEYHHRMVVAAETLEEAKQLVRQDNFFTSRLGVPDTGEPHIDNKYDIDDILVINDLVPGCKIVLTQKESTFMAPEPVVNGWFSLDAADPFKRGEG